MARSGVTYYMLVTLLTFHAPMSLSKADAPRNIELYADTQQREAGRADTPSVQGTRQWCGIAVASGSRSGGSMAGRYVCYGGVLHRDVVTVIVAIIQVRITMVGI